MPVADQVLTLYGQVILFWGSVQSNANWSEGCQLSSLLSYTDKIRWDPLFISPGDRRLSTESCFMYKI